MGKRRRPTPPRRWTPFQRTTAVHRLTGEPSGDPEAEHWVNSHYFVELRHLEPKNPEHPPLIWLSIHHVDRRPVHDWRHLQRIKNELVGPEYEGMEMYPAESRLVDTSNQYHLWVVNDPAFRWPWGYGDRLVMDHDDPMLGGAVQRRLERT